MFEPSPSLELPRSFVNAKSPREMARRVTRDAVEESFSVGAPLGFRWRESRKLPRKKSGWGRADSGNGALLSERCEVH